MSAFKGTPGPWSGRHHFEPILIQGSSEVGLEIAFACGGGDPRRDEYMANARLIAAAPDLLNALTGLADAAEKRGIPCDAARAAIARATGEPA